MRYVEALPVRQDDEVFVLLRDPEDLCGGEMVVSSARHTCCSRCWTDSRYGRGPEGTVAPDRTGDPQPSIEAFHRDARPGVPARQWELVRVAATTSAGSSPNASRPAAHAGVSYSADPGICATISTGFSWRVRRGRRPRQIAFSAGPDRPAYRYALRGALHGPGIPRSAPIPAPLPAATSSWAWRMPPPPTSIR
jgi:hypothetical protein